MPGLINYRGDDDYPFGVSLCPDDTSLLFTFGSQVEIYCPPRKRSRITGPCVRTDTSLKDKRPSIDVLPNECLFEILRRLPNAQVRSSAACVSMRWLNVLSSIRSSEFQSNHRTPRTDTIGVIKADASAKEPMSEVECDGYLTRCVEGKKATDVRLTSIALGTSSRGGLGKLSIRGSNSSRGVTSFGLSAIARQCPSLRVLSLWDLPSIGDEGLTEISRECRGLEKLDLCRCPSISDKGLVAIAENSPNLTSLTLESCSNIGNDSLIAVAKNCPKLQSIAIKDCLRVGDNGIANLLSSASNNVLNKVKLQGLNITDYSVAVIGHYGEVITSLVLSGLHKVSQKGFWVMSSGKGLKMLSSLTVSSCKGITDLSIEALGKGCPNLKHLCLRKCCFVSNNGLIGFGKASNSLESLQLEECNRISQMGVLTALSCSESKLKSIAIVKCMAIKDLSADLPVLTPCESLRSLTIRSCPGFGGPSLAVIGKLCPRLLHLDVSGLCTITDDDLLPLFESCANGLTKVNLSGCSKLTDQVIFSLGKLHGRTLETLNLDGCHNITDETLKALAYNCPLLKDLDVSKCSITDSGVISLSQGVVLNLRVLSISSCSTITSACINALEKLGKNMVGLNVQHCSSLSRNAIELLAENLWRCDVLY